MNEKPVGVAVLGLGNVGSQVVRIIQESADDLTARIGAPLVLRGVGVRRVADDRGVPVELLTNDIGQTSNVGPTAPRSRSASNNDSVCAVLWHSIPPATKL